MKESNPKVWLEGTDLIAIRLNLQPVVSCAFCRDSGRSHQLIEGLSLLTFYFGGKPGGLALGPSFISA